MINHDREPQTQNAKKPRAVLDVERMTNRQMLRELGKLHEELLGRLDNCYEMGAETPEALDEGILLAARLDRESKNFLFGKTRPGEWSWGVSTFADRLANVAVAAE